MKVTLHIVGTQAFDGEHDTVTQTVEAEKTVEEHRTRLHYIERDEEGTVTKVTVTADDREVTVERQGAARSLLRMQRGTPCRCQYGTPYGTFEVTTNTHTLQNTLYEPQGTLTLAYTLTLGGQVMENTLCMTIERNEPQ